MGWKGQVVTKKELFITLADGMPPTEKSKFVLALLSLMNDDAVFDYVDATEALSIIGEEDGA